jgi:hypothetical protein
MNTSEQMNEEVAGIKSILQHRIKRDIRRSHSYFALKDQVATGFMYHRWVGKVTTLCRRSCTRKRVITDPYLPLTALPNETGAYGELPRQPYRLERLPKIREANFSSPYPSVGLLKDYRLEFLHKGFGLGGHLYSQTLFPGETVSLDMRTYHKYKKTVTENTGENIFEEASADTMEDFSKELKAQFQWERSASKSKDGEVGGSFGANILDIVTIGAEGGAKWSSRQDERSFADKIESVLSKLSTKLSQKRQVTFDVKRQQSSEEDFENEIKTTKTYANDNKEKNLTINFFQITREYETRLFLQDVKFFYTSGRYPLLKVFVSRDFTDAEICREVGARLNLEEIGLSLQELLDDHVVEILPPELWDHFPLHTLVVVTAPPFNVKLAMAQTNSFLMSTFTLDKAREVNHQIWRTIGGGQAAPDGLSVCAFPFGKEEHPGLWPTDGADQPWPYQAQVGDYAVCADRVQLKGEHLSSTLPNLDIRYKESLRTPSRFMDAADGFYSLPTQLWSKSYVVNTNGVYAENMLGRCTALEEFAVNHRILDVHLKELQVEKERILLDKTRAEVDKARALTPPVRDRFSCDDDFLRCLEQYLRIKACENECRHDLQIPERTNVNFTVSPDKENANLVIAVSESKKDDTAQEQ